MIGIWFKKNGDLIVLSKVTKIEKSINKDGYWVSTGDQSAFRISDNEWPSLMAALKALYTPCWVVGKNGNMERILNFPKSEGEE